MCTRGEARTRCIAAGEARSTTDAGLAVPLAGAETEEVATPLEAELVGLAERGAWLTLTSTISSKSVAAEAVPTDAADPADAAAAVVRVEPVAPAVRSADLTSLTSAAAAVAASP
jgi:hypothetical protein